MKFIHIADVHIGTHFSKSSFGSFAAQRRSELKETFYRLLDFIEQNKIDLLLIAGDLFEEKSVTIGEIKEISYKLSKIIDTKIIIVAGNHDPLISNSIYNWVDWSDNVYIMDKGSNIIEIAELNTCIYGHSWDSKMIQEPLVDKIKIINEDKINIILAHGEIGQKSNYLPISKKSLLEKDVDYVALGHIHKHEFIAPNIAYSGSLEPLDFSEEGSHGFVYGEVEDGKKEFKFIPFSCRKFNILSMEIDEDVNNESLKENALNILNGENKEDLFRIILKGYHDPNINFDTVSIEKYLKENEYYVELIDKTKPSYNLERLLKENEENIIGKYIGELIDKAEEDEQMMEALYYGLEALLDEKVRAC
ncbi:MAG: exonuclease SbcCD subunit D [Eubacteriales bacterium]